MSRSRIETAMALGLGIMLGLGIAAWQALDWNGPAMAQTGTIPPPKPDTGTVSPNPLKPGFQGKIGRTFKVLIDKKEAGRYLGRTEFDSVEVDNEVIINSDKKLTVGEFVQVKMTKAYDFDLEGEVVK